ncbi:hypothetical protein QL285_014586 [Trifolium repens]|nr:hypothetical protein QL285_014586 [Trifolium repens]
MSFCPKMELTFCFGIIPSRRWCSHGLQGPKGYHFVVYQIRKKLTVWRRNRIKELFSSLLSPLWHRINWHLESVPLRLLVMNNCWILMLEA